MNIFNKIWSSITGVKTNVMDLLQGIGYVTGSGVELTSNIAPMLAYQLANRNDALGNSIDRISKAVSTLKIGIKGSDNKLNYNHPILKLLNNPGEGYSGTQFIKELTDAYLLCQEAWIVTRGNVSNAPLAMTFIRPYSVNMLLNYNDGLPSEIITNCNRDRRTYKRQIIKNKIRFVDESGLNEIIPIIGAVSVIDEWRGKSPLNKLLYDVYMNTEGKKHNVSLIRNGMRTTGIMTPRSTKETTNSWNDDIVKRIQSKLRENHQGSENAGNLLVFGAPAEIQGLTQNNKDMDYLALLNRSDIAIYNTYEIPLPLVLSETMTLDNYTMALEAFYLNAVFPNAEQILSSIMSGIGFRFGLTENEQLTFSEKDVRNMRSVLTKNMETLKNTGVVMVNETRQVGGFEPIQGGDVVLVNSTQVPLASVTTITDDDSDFNAIPNEVELDTSTTD